MSEGNNPDYGRIYKAINVISEGNVPVVSVACASILEADLSKPANQLAIRDCGGLQHLIKYVYAADQKLRFAVGTIYSRIAVNPFIQVALYDLRQTRTLVETLMVDTDLAVKAIGLDIVAKLASYHRNRTVIREAGGVQVAVKALQNAMSKSRASSPADLNICESAALFMWKCSNPWPMPTEPMEIPLRSI